MDGWMDKFICRPCLIVIAYLQKYPVSGNIHVEIFVMCSVLPFPFFLLVSIVACRPVLRSGPQTVEQWCFLRGPCRDVIRAGQLE
jgi:hypothetical protein